MDALVRRLDALAVDDRHDIHRVIRLALHDASKAIADLRTRPTPDGEIGELVAWLLDCVATAEDACKADGDNEVYAARHAKLRAIATALETQAADIARLREALEGVVSGARLPPNRTRSKWVTIPSAAFHKASAALATRTDVR